MAALPRAAVQGLVHSVDFQRVLAAPMRSRSAHFACHHVGTGPTLHKPLRYQPVGPELSTSDAPVTTLPVDDSHWLGSVVPKRHARRAVTRTLLKRQIRAAVARHAAALRPGLWVVRLRLPFAPRDYPSAASDALRCAARTELDTLLARAAR